MLKIYFDGKVSYNTLYDFDDVADGVICDIARRSDELASCTVNIDIMGINCDVNQDEDGFTPRKIGELEIHAFNTSRCGLDIHAATFDEFDGEDILFDVMDMCGDDAAYWHILKDMYDQIRPDEALLLDVWDDTYIIALQRFFINPEFRGKGIGRYIANNLAKIIYNTSNIKPLYVVGVLNPDDDSEETKAIQKRTMESAGITVTTDYRGECQFVGCIFDEDII